jgi:hypothetical protein
MSYFLKISYNYYSVYRLKPGNMQKKNGQILTIYILCDFIYKSHDLSIYVQPYFRICINGIEFIASGSGLSNPLKV